MNSEHKECEKRQICLCRTTPELSEMFFRREIFSFRKETQSFKLPSDVYLKTSWENSAELHVSSWTRTLDVQWASAGVKKKDEGSELWCLTLTHALWFQTLWNDLEEFCLIKENNFVDEDTRRERRLGGEHADVWNLCGAVKPVWTSDRTRGE